MIKLNIYFFLIISIHTSAQDILDPYRDYSGLQFSVLDAYSTGAGQPPGSGIGNFYKLNNSNASGSYNGEYEILLDLHPWGNEGLIEGTVANPLFELANFGLSFQIELVSFPFSIDCCFPSATDLNGGCKGSLFTDRVFNVPDNSLYDPVVNEYWEYPTVSSSNTNKLWRLSELKSFDRQPFRAISDQINNNSLVSNAFGNDQGGSINHTVLPHSILKHTINIHFGNTDPNTDPIISSFSFGIDLTRGRLREYPYRPNNPNSVNINEHDLLIRPTFLPSNSGDYNTSEVANCSYFRYKLNYNSICTNPNFETCNINYTPFDPLSDNNCSFIPDNLNAVYGDDFSLPGSEVAPSFDMHRLPLANYTLNLLTAIRNFDGTTLSGYNRYTGNAAVTMDLIETNPLIHKYTIDKNIDLSFINPSEKTIYNPSEVSIYANNLKFPANYTFKTIRAIFPLESDVDDAINDPKNGGPFTDPTKRDIPVKTDLFKEFHVVGSQYSNTDHKLASIYHLESGSKLTIEPCVKIFDATFEINPGSEIVFENWLTNQINVDRYQLLFTGGIVTKRVDHKYFQHENEVRKILNWEAADFISSGENVDNSQTQGEYSVEPGADVRFTATNYIDLKPGFTAKYGGDFLASIDNVSLPGCPPMRIRNPHPENANDYLGFPNEIGYFTCSPNPASDKSYLMFEIKDLSTAKILIYNSMGDLIEVIGKNSILPPGKYSYPLPVSNLSAGLYIAKLQTGGSQKSLKFIKQ